MFSLQFSVFKSVWASRAKAVKHAMSAKVKIRDIPDEPDIRPLCVAGYLVLELARIPNIQLGLIPKSSIQY